MPKSHRPYPPEYRQRIIDLVRKGRTPEELSRQFEPSVQCIRNWVRQADRDDGRRTHMKAATRAYVDGYGLAVPREVNVATASTGIGGG